MAEFEVILVGGGLANGLIAAHLGARRPSCRILMVEAADRIGGNHTWSFHESDVSRSQDEWLSTFVPHRWPEQHVRFPGHSRRLATGYRTLTSLDLRDAVERLENVAFRLQSRVSDVESDHIVIDGGETIRAPCIIDGRGLTALPGAALGYQKFVGLEVETSAPHGLDHPVIMDATVTQHDGYRFVYCLPYSPTHILIEDTYYADDPEIDRDLLTRRVLDYAAAKGWKIARTVREEAGVLPIVLDGDIEDIWPKSSVAARAGMRSGLFHQTTSYSLPFAVRTAEAVSGLGQLASKNAAERIRSMAVASWREQGYFRMLNRMLFLAASGEQRRDIFERFYRLSHPIIERFYAARLNIADKARILAGRPPIPIADAVWALPSGAARRRRHLALSDG